MNYQIAGVICHTCAVIINNGDDSMYDINDADTARQMRRTFTLGLHDLTKGRHHHAAVDGCCEGGGDHSGTCEICGDTECPFHSVEVDLNDTETPAPIICEETGSTHSYVYIERGGEKVCRFCGLSALVTGEVDE